MNENRNQEYDEISIIEIINILLKGKALIIMLLCVGLALGVGYSFYQKASSPEISVSAIELLSSNNAKINVEKNRFLFESKVLTDEFIEKYELSSDESIELEHVSDGLFTIAVSSNDAETANKANQFAIDSFSKILDEDYEVRDAILQKKIQEVLDSMQAGIDTYSEEIDVLSSELSRIELEQGLGLEYDAINERYAMMNKVLSLSSATTEKIVVNVISFPEVEEYESELAKNLAIGIVLGLFMGVLLVFVRNWWSKNKEQLVMK